MRKLSQNVNFMYWSLLAPLLLTSCFKMGTMKDAGAPATGGNSAASQNPVVTADFASLNSTIFQPKCVSCHNPTTRAGNYDMSGFTPLVSGGHVKPFDPSMSSLYLRIKDNSMPPGGPLSAAEIQAVAEWITAGATGGGPFAPPVPSPTALPPGSPPTPAPMPTAVPVPTQTPTPPPAQVAATYSSIASQIITPKCVNCHGNGGKKPRLVTYSDVLAITVPGNGSASKLYTSVTTGGMPLGQPLSASEISAIKSWIDGGAPNN